MDLIKAIHASKFSNVPVIGEEEGESGGGGGCMERASSTHLKKGDKIAHSERRARAQAPELASNCAFPRRAKQSSARCSPQTTQKIKQKKSCRRSRSKSR